MSKITWIPVQYELPKESDSYLVWIHESNEADPWMMGEDGTRFDTGYTDVAFFNQAQGGIWIVGRMDNVFGSDLSKIDMNKHCYISHWSPLPDGPKEE